ncbi:MAG: 30S ribosome-binding factor RbfA [Marinilabiliales bacterium]|mgnify:CR=1 FL=1|nr:MAG: 30S ribosome-binding factor RbfA [Marinilabiliales bacterium]
MQNKRQLQVSGVIHKELASLFTHKFSGLVPGRLLTITDVNISPDLGIAKVYISIFPSTDGQKIIKEINNNVSKIRYELGKIIKNDLKRIPELSFYLDDSLDRIDRIDNALKNS